MDLHRDSIDRLTEFANCGVRRNVTWESITVHIIGIDELIAPKLAAGRARDLDDARSLETVRRR